ncbi:MAG: hypothetical protein ACK2UX_05755 [Anaerolineae bacterium]
MNDPSPSFGLVIHATHEAGVKVGGIGAVLDGLLGSEAYNAGVRETMLVGTIDVNNPEEMERLLSPSNALDVAYSSVHDIVDAAADLIDGLREIERRHDVTILYGTRAFGNTKHRILLVD